MSKIELVVPRDQREAVLQWLQDKELVHLAPLSTKAARPAAETDTAYQLAQLQFALEFLGRVRTEANLQPKRSFKDFFAPRPSATLEELEATLATLSLDSLLTEVRTYSDALADLATTTTTLSEQIDVYTPWRELRYHGGEAADHPEVAHRLLTVTLPSLPSFIQRLEEIPSAVWQEVSRLETKKRGFAYLEVLVHTDDGRALEALLPTTHAEPVHLDLPAASTVADHIEALTRQKEAAEAERAAIFKKAQALLKLETELQRAYDALLHRQEREAVERDTVTTSFMFALAGWVPTAELPAFTKELETVFPTSALETITPADDEVPPVHFTNNRFFQPFEAVTNIYGKPRYTELDPSPALSVFFLASFGLALTDAGYGMVLMAGTYAAERFFKLKREMRKMVRLLFYAGFATIILGALTGGWFGITLEDLPANAVTNFLLRLKVIDPLAQPMQLLGVAFAIGVVQLLFAWVVRGYDHWRQKDYFALWADDVAWFTLVSAILVWIAARQGIITMAVAQPLQWFIYANALVLVLTQGRTYKNAFVRVGSGLISLYGLVTFMSDMLSYSRLLALGLATGIIGLVVNLLGGMVASSVPGIGIVLAAIVLLVGHTFNLGINSLGAFIHSGRLQFVEFFPKFMEGGGVPFKPLGRVSKYIDNPADYTS